jgi:FHS family Na+ dependent glucose MFS transporter 1
VGPFDLKEPVNALASPQPPSKSAYLWAYYSSLVGVGLMVGVFGPTLGALALQTHSSLQGISLILATRTLGYLGGTLLCGRLLDKTPGHPILAAAILLAAVAVALIPLAPVLGLLAALILIMGFAQGLMDVGSNTLIVWVYREKVGPYLNGLHFFFGLGAFLAPVMVAQSLALSGSTPGAFWALALCLLIPFSILLKVPSPDHAESAEEEKEAGAAWDKALAALFLAFFFLYGGTEAGFGAWIYSYATHLHLGDPAQSAYLSSLFWGLLGLGRLIGVPVIARVSPQRVLKTMIPLALVSLGGLLSFPQSPVALWIGTAGMGLSLACVFPSLLLFGGPRLSGSSRVTGKVTSFFFIGSASGGTVLPWLMGQVFEPWGPTAALGLTLLSSTLMACVFLMILKKTKPS